MWSGLTAFNDDLAKVEYPLKILPYSRELEGVPCRALNESDLPDLMKLIEHMICYATTHHGCGLAAPQVGVFVQLAIVFTGDEGPDDRLERWGVLINPVVEGLGGKDILDSEACLSIPPHNATARVLRSERITVQSGTLDDPNKRVISHHQGREARIIQHEIDHLCGTFFINRVSNLQRQLVLQRYAKYIKRYSNGHL